METVGRYLKSSFRSVMRNPGFTAAVVLTLALGIGANTAIFSVLYGLLLRPLPYEHPERMVRIYGENQPREITRGSVSYPDFVSWRDESSSFEHIALVFKERYGLSELGEPEELEGARTAAAFFEVFGIKPVVGRFFTEEEERTGQDGLAVISHAFWQRRFNGAPNAVGQSIDLDGRKVEIIGVAPEGFHRPNPTDLWLPLNFESKPPGRGRRSYWAVALRKPDVSVTQAQADLDAIGRRLEQEYPDSNTGESARVVDFRESEVGDVKGTVLILAAAVGFVLLIACTNVANLLLARGAGRRREASLQLALGAARKRLAGQIITESILLSLLGAAVGLLPAYGVIRFLVSLDTGYVPLLGEVSIDGWVLAFTFGLALLTGLLFSLVPALRAARTDINEVLKEGGKSSTGVGHRRVQNALIVSQVTLVLLLLAGAGLMTRTLLELSRVDLGFRPERLLTVQIVVSPRDYPEPYQRAAVVDQVMQRLSSLPSVEGVGVVSFLPISGQNSSDLFTLENRVLQGPEDQVFLNSRSISPNYFQVMGISLLQGRDFNTADLGAGMDAPGSAIVNESTARQYWPDQNPIGKRLKQGDEGSPLPWLTVVGVARDIRHFGVTEEPQPEVYVAHTRDPIPLRTFVVRTAGDPLAVAAAARNAIWEINPKQIIQIRTMEQRIAETLGKERLMFFVLAVLAVVALSLAAIGIYGVISFLVAERTREIGVRMALGAQRSSVIGQLMQRTVFMTVIGVVIGLIAALAMMRVLESLLFGITATDPITLAAVTFLLLLVAAVAGLVPALRASRLDPSSALRYE